MARGSPSPQRAQLTLFLQNVGLDCDHSSGGPVQAFTIRQLKSNPSTVIRAAEAYAMALFQSGSISTAAAARIAGLPLPHFLELLTSLGIPLSSSDPADTGSDLEAARRWLGLNAPAVRA